MNEEESIKYINEQQRIYKGLVHASNINTKLKKIKSGKKLAALKRLSIKYAEYLKNNLELKSWDDSAIDKRVQWLNEYYNFYDNPSPFDYNKEFTAQGKLRPTILEEFLFLLFMPYMSALKEEKDDKNVISSGIAKAYTNLYFSPSNLSGFVDSPSVKVNEKDQDYAIYRDIIFQVIKQKIKKRKKTVEDYENNIQQQVATKIPIFAAEVKTYLDKTMLEGVIATAEKLKMGNPYARSVVVTETYEVDINVDPSYSQIDQIYVLRKCSNKDAKQTIQSDVVKVLFSDAKRHIEGQWSDVESKLKNSGLII